MKECMALYRSKRTVFLRWNDMIFPSSSFWGAICEGWSLLYGESSLRHLQEAVRSGCFRFSSLFPYWQVGQNEKPLLFFPKPALPEVPKSDPDQEAFANRKKLKKICFLSQNLFEKVVQNTEDQDGVLSSWFDLSDDKNLIQRVGKYAFLKSEMPDPGHLSLFQETLPDEMEIPRVSVNRLAGEGTFFAMNYLQMYSTWGVFLLFRYSDDLEISIKAVLRLIADHGIGGHRGYGRGIYDQVVFNDFVWKGSESSFYVNLSRSLPEKDSVQYLQGLEYKKDDGFVYHRGGYPAKKDPLYLLSEGTVSRKNFQGKMIDASSETLPVLRYAYSYLIPQEGQHEI